MCLLLLTTLVLIARYDEPSTELIVHRRYDHCNGSNVRSTTSQMALVELVYTTLTLGYMRTMDMMQTCACTVHSHTHTCLYVASYVGDRHHSSCASDGNCTYDREPMGFVR